MSRHITGAFWIGVLVLGWVLVYPLLVLWAVQTLFAVPVTYSLSSWVAVQVLASVLVPQPSSLWKTLWEAV